MITTCSFSNDRCIFQQKPEKPYLSILEHLLGVILKSTITSSYANDAFVYQLKLKLVPLNNKCDAICYLMQPPWIFPISGILFSCCNFILGPGLTSSRYYSTPVKGRLAILYHLLTIFHPRPFLLTRFSPQGTVACVRAESQDYLDIVFRFTWILIMGCLLHKLVFDLSNNNYYYCS